MQIQDFESTSKDTRTCWIYWTQSKTQNKKSSDLLIWDPWATMCDPNEHFILTRPQCPKVMTGTDSHPSFL